MNILIVSQCTKNALTETRRILDQFAERRGHRTWQTHITQQGLQALKRLLKRSARRNTAVACHWMRGRDRTDLLWIVGNAGRFNEQGAVPTNITERDVLRKQDENNWHSAEDIALLASMAGLFHDFGKANSAFQRKLKNANGRPMADAYRHEWVSLRLFEAFVNKQEDRVWLQNLVDSSEAAIDSCLQTVYRDGLDESDIDRLCPFECMPPLAQVIGWLIVSHHRLPTQNQEEPQSSILKCLPLNIDEDWCGRNDNISGKQIQACWKFNADIPLKSQHWQQHAAKIARIILSRPGMVRSNYIEDPYVLHLSRMALMLADHYYSSQPSHSRYGDKEYPLYANTHHKTHVLKQRLDEHLIGVEVNAGKIARMLPRLEFQLPRLARHRGFRQRSRDKCFQWQDKAFDLATSVQERSLLQGFFGVNMASTGCGKTLANGRILYGLSDPQLGARFSVALGLRSLTLQTGDAYRERLELGDDDMAVLVGGAAIRELHQRAREDDSLMSISGSESAECLVPDYQHVSYEGSIESGPFSRWLDNNPNARRLLSAPILTCTIDHLMPATEATRGGHQIAPMLRLLTSDLVLDEPDDFSTEDLPALSRLVNWAGLLGSRVLISSATLPPAIVQGLFSAYVSGRRCYQQNRGVPGQPVSICCAWFDEYESRAADHALEDSFIAAHLSFVEKRVAKLSKAEKRRKATVKPLSIASGSEKNAIYKSFAQCLHEHIHNLHNQHHTVDQITGKKVSLGLVRIANIDSLVGAAKELYSLDAEYGYHLHICVYHSQHPLLVRSEIESQLDTFLNRKDPVMLFRDSRIRDILDRKWEENHIFIVLATAVAEVGRDHDYDWGIVEPSSMRSIIQLAGRIRRHRPGFCKLPNLYLLGTNIRHIANGPSQPAYCRPGFESSQFLLESHYLSELLTRDQLSSIDATTRIIERRKLEPTKNLVDLEHSCMRAWMFGKADSAESLVVKPASWWWVTRATLSGELQRVQPFRYDPLGRQRYGLLPNDDGEIRLHRYKHDGRLVDVNNLIHPNPFDLGCGVSVWGGGDFETILMDLAEKLDMEVGICARRFGFVELPDRGSEQGWYYDFSLGFSRFR